MQRTKAEKRRYQTVCVLCLQVTAKCLAGDKDSKKEGRVLCMPRSMGGKEKRRRKNQKGWERNLCRDMTGNHSCADSSEMLFSSPPLR